VSRENVETVRALYEGWVEGDFQVGLDSYAEDLRFTIDSAVSVASGEFRGVDGMRDAWRDQLSEWRDYRTGPIEHVLESGDRIVAFNRKYGRGKRSGIEAGSPRVAAVFTFRDGKIAELLLTNLRGALDAVGLRE
jgi:ketosteroid isomerase-like protein